MTKTRTALTLAALVTMGTGFATFAEAQGRGGDRDGGGRRGGMPSMLRAGSPEVGDSLPSVAIYTDDGTPIQTHQLDGKFKVIGFGCLT